MEEAIGLYSWFAYYWLGELCVCLAWLATHLLWGDEGLFMTNVFSLEFGLGSRKGRGRRIGERTRYEYNQPDL